MKKFKLGDIVEVRQDISSFVTIKVIGKITKVLKNNLYEVSNRQNKHVIGTFKSLKLRLR